MQLYLEAFSGGVKHEFPAYLLLQLQLGARDRHCSMDTSPLPDSVPT